VKEEIFLSSPLHVVMLEIHNPTQSVKMRQASNSLREMQRGSTKKFNPISSFFLFLLAFFILSFGFTIIDSEEDDRVRDFQSSYMMLQGPLRIQCSPRYISFLVTFSLVLMLRLLFCSSAKPVRRKFSDRIIAFDILQTGKILN
jgi:hypothetical protein